VAKVVKTLGLFRKATESLDDFRYGMPCSVPWQLRQVAPLASSFQRFSNASLSIEYVSNFRYMVALEIPSSSAASGMLPRVRRMAS
jgi:hypothetical protein